ncbi:coiled-coil domain-containing protein 167-like [Centruroides vittatus]|uniref:coiled-coil domain-containing protein 167-like n=1 Tax=Centruroides vittatus TaxID=120091 RepID=UPI00350EDBAB
MSIAQQIEEKEALVAKQLEKLNSLENRMRSCSLSSSQKKALEETIQNIKEQLRTLEKELKLLRKENRRSFIVTIFLFILMILIYYFVRWPW